MGFFVPVAISVGLNLLSSFFAPKPPQPDLQVPRSEYGFPIPKVYGRVRIEGNKFWPDTKEQMFKNKRRPSASGGKGGRRNQAPPEVYGTVATLFGQGPLDLISIVLNGEEYDTEHSLFKNHCTWFDGTQTAPWSEMVALENPPDNQIAYTGVAYLGIKRLPLRDDFGSQIPQQISAVIQDKTLGENPPLSAVVLDICTRAGLDPLLLDVSEIANIPLKHGFVLFESGEGYRQVLEDLFQVYLFTAYEKKDGTIGFKSIDSVTPLKTINDSDYHPVSGSSIENKSIIKAVESKTELPNQINIKFKDPNKQYQTNEIIEYFEESIKQNSVTLSPQWTTSPVEARYRARRLLRALGIQTRTEYTLKVPSYYYSTLELLDHIPLPNGEKIQITSLVLGADYMLEIKGRTYLGDQPFEDPPDSFLPIGGTPDINVVPFFILDTPLISSAHLPGTLYLFAPAPMRLFTEKNAQKPQSGQQVGLHEQVSTIGDCLTVLPQHPSGIFGWQNVDTTSTLDVVITSGASLNSLTEDEFNSRQNLALIGSVTNNRWEGEFIAFRDVELLSENTYRISYLQRGLFRTNFLMSGHSTDSKFFLLNGDGAYFSLITFFTDYQPDSIFSLGGFMRFYSLSSSFQNPDDGFILDVEPKIESARPVAVSNIRGTINPEETITYRWDYISPISVYNVGENTVTYKLEFLDNLNNVVRTEELEQNNYIYPLNVRQNDGYLSSTITVRVTAVNVVGEGQPVTAEIVPLSASFSSDENRVQVNNVEQPPRPITQFKNTNSIIIASELESDKSILTFNTRTISKSITTNYTLQLEDEFKWLKCSGDITITAPANINTNYSFECIVQNVGTGTITIAGIPDAEGDKITIRWRAAHLFFDTIEWTAVGALSL